MTQAAGAVLEEARPAGEAAEAEPTEGPRRRPFRQPRGSREPRAFKVVPVRIPTDLLARIDQARAGRGIRSRNEFFVQAVTAAVQV